MDSCQTKYPILLIHGMGFRDSLPIHYYWGRIPGILRKHGAVVYSSMQDANAPTEHNARCLEPFIRDVLQKTGSPKVNIIAHSKGGLEARYLISTMGMGDAVASLTTLSTPHNGSKTIDWLLPRFRPLICMGSRLTDVWRRILGDSCADTFTVIEQLTTGYMQEFNRANPDDPRIFYQSYAFVMKHWYSDGLMGFANSVVYHFEGENDGLLTPDSARWTNFRGVYRGTGWRGISHPDVTDYRRHRFSRKEPGNGQISDITKLYLSIVQDLKRRGL